MDVKRSKLYALFFLISLDGTALQLYKLMTEAIGKKNLKDSKDKYTARNE